MKNNIILIALTIISGCSIASIILGFLHYASLFELLTNTFAHVILLFALYKGFEDIMEKQ